MIHIGGSYLKKEDGQVYLCSDVTINEETRTIWYSLPEEQESALCVGRADPFVVLLFPRAMRGGDEIVCEDVMSEKLHYQLLNYLMPSLVRAGDKYHPVKIKAALTDKVYPNAGAVGTGFTGGVDSLYTILTHGTECEYPLTHLALFDFGGFEGDHEQVFCEACHKAAEFAEKQNLHTIFLNTNFQDVLPEVLREVGTFRRLSCALALQGLFSVYLLSSCDACILCIYLDMKESYSYDLISVNSMSTETIAIYLAGIEAPRIEKLEKLTAWPASYTWLHPCEQGYAGTKNCGHCMKCLRTESALWAFGKLDLYRSVFDADDFLAHLPQNLGMLMTEPGIASSEDTIAWMNENNVEIPPKAYRYAKLFARAKDVSYKIREKEAEERRLGK